MEIKLTKADCASLYEAWEGGDFETVKDAVLEMNQLEAMKFARQIMMFYSEDGGLINQIINYILADDSL